MIDPNYIKWGAIAAGAVLLLWPLIPKLIEWAKKAVAVEHGEATFVEATACLGRVKAYLDSDDPDIEGAIEDLAIAIVKKGL